jgi:hypothetical protein
LASRALRDANASGNSQGLLADHRDVFLTEDEKRAGDRMMLCVSRAHSPRITLDL